MTTATNEKVGAYKTHQNKNETDREIEARALLTCASQLGAARESEGLSETYTEAIKRNQRLWTIFQVALCDQSNPLPHDLKTTLLNLSCYVDKVSFRALAEFKPLLLTSLIEINRNVANGLSRKPKAENPMPVNIPAALPSGPVMTTA